MNTGACGALHVKRLYAKQYQYDFYARCGSRSAEYDLSPTRACLKGVHTHVVFHKIRCLLVYAVHDVGG